MNILNLISTRCPPFHKVLFLPQIKVLIKQSSVNNKTNFSQRFLCQIIQREFPCTARPAPNYASSFFFKFPPLPPTSSTQTHFFLPTPVLLCPSALPVSFQFISSLIISSIPPLMASTNALPFFFAREMKGAQRKMNSHPPSLSRSLSTYQMYCMPRLVEPGIWKWSRGRWEGVPQAVQMTNE